MMASVTTMLLFILFIYLFSVYLQKTNILIFSLSIVNHMTNKQTQQNVKENIE